MLKRNRNATSSAEMKGRASPTTLLDKTTWNPRPVIDLVWRAVSAARVLQGLSAFFRPPKAKIFAPQGSGLHEGVETCSNPRDLIYLWLFYRTSPLLSRTHITKSVAVGTLEPT